MPDNYGNQLQQDTDSAQWRVIDSLRKAQSDTDKEIAVINYKLTAHEQNAANTLALLQRIDAKIEHLSSEMSQAKGGLGMAKWLAGFAASISGAGVAFIAWLVGK
jgi:hypothetical protein